MIHKYDGKTSKNARININYSENKPKVTFSYPDYNQQRDGNMLPPIFGLVGLLVLLNFSLLRFIIEYPQDIKYQTLLFLGFISIWIGFSLLVYYPLRPFWKSKYPKYQALVSRKKKITFRNKDIKKDGKGYYCELILFANIILDYLAKEDFAKYLIELDIREHNFRYFYGKKNVNEWLWYARFYFSSKPHKGDMEVIFK